MARFKAMILAAGLATRLRPYSEHTPKALFPLAGRPLIDRLIDRLATAGCEAVIVNTHHLADRLEAHLASARYPIPVLFRREAHILGTGGGIANAADFFDQHPFMVVNADIDTDIDLAAFYRFHLGHSHPASLALTDFDEINTVSATEDGRVVGFDLPDPARTAAAPIVKRTFTGIQVLDPGVPAMIEPGRASSIIDLYRRMIAEGTTVCAYFAPGCWADLGTPDRYLDAAARHLAVEAFGRAAAAVSPFCIEFSPLAGDGSQRRWFRVSTGETTLVMASHGIRCGQGTQEVDSFVDIGRHLASRQVPVPKIFSFDRFSGLVFTEDLGDQHLQAAVIKSPLQRVLFLYRRVIDAAIHMGLDGAEGFDPKWTWQSPRYDRGLILEKECRYFCEAFVAGHLGRPDPFRELTAEFFLLADRIEHHAVEGFIHRDLQSRNIMLRNDKIHFIDFQGGRTGPVQYDLASLLIDPYVDLAPEHRRALTAYAMDRLSELSGTQQSRCLAGFRYCALSRNLQVLGAFGFLTGLGKSWFEAAIPNAVASLNRVLAVLPEEEFPKLAVLAEELMNT
ncbi:MAG: NTP transferase domain-containing protein [Desulfobacterales bacterium]|nr:NTP transferase domain-containing protein [Desulfobacterales bacterium]